MKLNNSCFVIHGIEELKAKSVFLYTYLWSMILKLNPGTYLQCITY